MNTKTATLAILALFLIGGLGALLSVSKDDRAAAAVGQHVEVSDVEVEQAGELEAFESFGESRGVASLLPSRGVQSVDIAEMGQAIDVASTPFTGKVVGPRGEATAGAEVQVKRDFGLMSFSPTSTRPSSGPILTDSSGVFLVRELPRSALRIEIKASGFAPFSEKLERQQVGPGNVPTSRGDLGVFTLEPGVTMRGVVLDSFGGPVFEAALHLEQSEQRGGVVFLESLAEEEPDAVTAQDGSFSLESVGLGPWAVTASHTDHPSAKITGSSDRVGVHPENLQIQLPEGGVITGVVEGAEPGSEYEVVARKSSNDWAGLDFNRTAEVEEGGRFMLQGLLLDEDYDLFATKAADKLPFGFNEPVSDRVKARTGQAGVVLKMLAPAGIQFRVVSAETGEPVENFRAEAGSWDLETLRDERGKVLMEHPDGRAHMDLSWQYTEGGGAKLVVVAQGFETFTLDGIELIQGQVLELGELRLKPASVLRVHITSGESGAPVSNARVSLSRVASRQAFPSGAMGVEFGSTGVSVNGADEVLRGFDLDRSERTDAEGWAELTVEPGLRCSLAVASHGFADLLLAPAIYQSGELELRLMKGGRVRVVVELADGEPAQGATVSLRGDDTPWGDSSQETGSLGVAVFDHLSSGTHAFRLLEPDSSPLGVVVMSPDSTFVSDEDWTFVEVAEGGEQELVLRQAARGVLFGRVTEGGKALPGATLNLRSWSENSQESPFFNQMAIFGGGGGEERTKGDGSYRMNEKPVGEYELLVNHAGRAMQEAFRVTLAPGESEFNVDLSMTGIEGYVFDDEGRPVEGAKVVAIKQSSVGNEMSASFALGSEDMVFELAGGSPGSKTDSEGKFQLKGVVEGEKLQLKVNKEPFQPFTQELRALGIGEVLDGLRVVLQRGGSLRIELVDSSGAPVEFASVMLTRLIEGEPLGVVRHGVSQEGLATFEGLAAGEWEVEVSAFSLMSNEGPDVESQQRRVVIKVGESVNALFQF